MLEASTFFVRKNMNLNQHDRSLTLYIGPNSAVTK